jgi:hypothetical protein
MRYTPYLQHNKYSIVDFPFAKSRDGLTPTSSSAAPYISNTSLIHVHRCSLRDKAKTRRRAPTYRTPQLA